MTAPERLITSVPNGKSRPARGGHRPSTRKREHRTRAADQDHTDPHQIAIMPRTRTRRTMAVAR